MSRDNDTPLERSRVFGKLAPIIMQYAERNAGRTFHVEQLRRYVERAYPGVGVAPDSPGRILRELRLLGKLDYVVLNRRDSLYQFRKKGT